MNREIKDIFRKIEINQGYLPKKELEELINRKDETTEYLISYMKDFLCNYKKALEDMSFFGHIYATYLLAQFKEKRFYDIYLDILELENNSALGLFDDRLLEDGGRIIASIYNGDNTRLIEIIQSEEAAKEIKMTIKEAFEIIESRESKLIDDIFKEIEEWECFSEEDDSLDNLIQKELQKGITNALLKKNKVGRNDPCICGSGKKFKKCCG